MSIAFYRNAWLKLTIQVHAQMRMRATTGKSLIGASFGVPANLLQRTRRGRDVYAERYIRLETGESINVSKICAGF
jgi:hypothetical protein